MYNTYVRVSLINTKSREITVKYNRYWLDRLGNKYGRFAIPNLMNIIVFGMTFVFLADMALLYSKGINLSSYLVFDTNAIYAGQFWRLISFVIIPPGSSILFIIFALYFFWLMGSSLEAEWGAFKFNVFYITGIIGTILSGLITGYATNSYLNLCMFLAFALLFPNHRITLFFFIPIKVKYLAYVDCAFLILAFVFATWQGKLAITAALLNIIFFFWRDILDGIKHFFMRITNKIKWKKKIKNTGWEKNSDNRRSDKTRD